MKFLCDNCKAKYQIPDEKVAGRTLRMTCRKCGNDILIRGAGVTPSVAPPAASAAPPAPAKASAAQKAAGAPKPAAAAKGTPKKAEATKAAAAQKAAPGASAAAKQAAGRAGATAGAGSSSGRPSALGADFRKKVGNEDAGSMRASMPAAAQPSATEEWHVAINDVPVGPIRRDEIARKIGTGAVTGDSLAWREGFDDWRPLRDIPQLASLLEQRRRPSVPAPSRPGSVPAPARSGSGSGASAVPRPTGPRGRAGAGSGMFNLPTSERSSSNLSPLGGRAVAPVAPPANTLPDAPIGEDDDFALDFASPSSVPPASTVAMAAATVPVAPAAALAPAAPAPTAPAPADPVPYERESSQKTPVWVWGMLAGGIFFGVVLGMKGSEWFGSREEPQVAVAPTPPATVTPDPIPQPLELPEPEATVDAGVEEETTPDAPSTPSRPSSSGGARPATSATAGMASAMADDSAFAQFESVGGMTVTPGTLTTTMTSASAPPLDPAAVSRVVSNNRRQLQTCYERAARGQANPPRARMDVNLTVGRSGTVTSVSATGNDFGGLGSCIQQSVRRWRFPASSDGGVTRFPVVFSAGG